jgi:hypothetical protein
MLNFPLRMATSLYVLNKELCMARKMKAAVFVEPGRIALDEKPIPEVGPLDALVRITTTTICGTDVHILKGEYPVAKGLTIGHEPVGRDLDASIAVIANALRVNYPWLVDVMRDLSGLGSTVTLAIAVGITVAYLLLIGLRFVGCAVAASSLSGIAAVSLLKGCLDALGRTRFPRSPQQLA